MMSKQAGHFYEFGTFRLNRTERLLTRDGQEVPLTPKVFDTLLVLVENGGRVLEKNELISLLWPDSFVEESSLSQNISLLRKALADGTPERQYIETIPKRGYRFVAGVSEIHDTGESMSWHHQSVTRSVVEEEAATESEDASKAGMQAADGAPRARRAIPAWRRYALLACALLLPLTLAAYFYRPRRKSEVQSVRSIAVLPFRTVGAGGEAEVMGLGMADAIIIRLSKLQEPVILPTTSVFKYTTREQDALSIGRSLGVDAVLDGTVQCAGERVRVTVQLITSTDGKTLWSGTFQEQYSNIFAVQDSIAEQLGVALMPQLTNADKERLARHPTENAEAYQAYLIGLNFWNRRSLAKAIPYLEQAIAQDPNFALAHAILADCYFLNTAQRLLPLQPGESASRAETLAVRALELDETVAEAHAVIAGLKVIRKDYIGAETEYKRALELNPNVATIHVRYGYFLFNSLQMEAALREMKRAQELDPVSATTNGALGYMLLMSRNYDEALKFARRADELDPTLPSVMVILGDVYLQKGMIDEALAVFRRLETQNRTTGQQFITYALSKSPRRADAQKALPDLVALADQGRVSPYNLAMIYGALGEKDKAFAWLKKTDGGPQTRALLRFDPDLDSLRSDERFALFASQYERAISYASPRP